MNYIEIEKIEDVLKQASKHPICNENRWYPQLKKDILHPGLITTWLSTMTHYLHSTIMVLIFDYILMK